jgi:hypothetical protein
MNCASCGHSKALHEHYRPDTDCAVCWCPRFVVPVWRLLIDVLKGRRRG